MYSVLAGHDRERRAFRVGRRGPRDGFVGHLADHAPSRSACLVEVVDDGGPVDLVPTASQVHEPYLRCVDLQNRASQSLLDGNPDRAGALADEAFAIGTESGQPEALMIYGVQLLDVRIHQGRAGELVDLVVAAIIDNPGLPSLRTAAARGCIDTDRLDDARGLLADSIDLALDDLWLVGTSMWAQVAARVGDLDSAAVLYERLTPWSGQVPSAVVVSQEPVDHCLGELAAVLGDVERAREHFAAAEATARQFGVPYWTGRTLIETARLDTVADPGAARSRATEALDLATCHGYARLRRDAAEVMSAAAADTR